MSNSNMKYRVIRKFDGGGISYKNGDIIDDTNSWQWLKQLVSLRYLEPIGVNLEVPEHTPEVREELVIVPTPDEELAVSAVLNQVEKTVRAKATEKRNYKVKTSV